MRKNRNCGAPMYPAFNPNIPMMGMPSPVITNQQPINPNYPNMYNQQNNNIEQNEREI